MLRVVSSASASARLDAAIRFLSKRAPDAEVVIVGASRGAADDLARSLALERGVLFGVYRFSLTQLAARLAAPLMARARLSPATGLGVQAVATRALFDASGNRSLSYFTPVSNTPGFPRALARTLEELALAGVPAPELRKLPEGGSDLADLLERFDEEFESVSAVERAAFLRMAARAARDGSVPSGWSALLLLDVAVTNAAERELVEALISWAPDALATVPAGDFMSWQVFDGLAEIEDLDSAGGADLDRLRRHLFAAEPPPPSPPSSDLEWFSAPGEGREAVEIARRILREARRGVPFDRMAVIVRSPEHYAGLLEHALTRAGVPAFFDRGTRRPHPAGRAFLALLLCATENLSARRFAEYLSLGQVPENESSTGDDSFPASTEEVFGILADRAESERSVSSEDSEDASGRTFRAPWKWEPLLAESRVVAGTERWTRRLNGLVEECELQRRDLGRRDPDSPKIGQVTRKMRDLTALTAFVLPIIRALAAFPVQASWAVWLRQFESLAPRVLRQPERVLRVLADLRPMGAVGPITLSEATQVLTDRLSTIESEPPSRRYGRVFVSSPAQIRGRRFDVVFVPSLAERMFPQRLREDPLLLDDSRHALDAGLVTQRERAELEKLDLRLAIGAAERRAYVSFPTVEVTDGRPRVPSLYALEVWRAMTGRVPGGEELQRAAAQAAQATLAWPAPANRDEAIDALEHDLATLRDLVGKPDALARGRAQYMLRLNDCLQRSVRERYMRNRPTWSQWDGLVRVTERTAAPLAAERLTARVYSLSALQRYSVCPYQFLLGAIYRLQPAQDLEALQHLDPLTRGSLFHAVQTAFFRQLKADGALPITDVNREHALQRLDAAVRHVAARYHELLAPAVERVWKDEIWNIRRDLRLWVDQVTREGAEWVQRWFEWGFGLGGGHPHGGGEPAERDPDSVPEPVLIDGRFPLRGSIDLVEERAGTGELRVTDHKTGKYRGREGMVVGGGAVLQPVLYSLALETATGRTVIEGRLYYATTDGGYRDVRIPLTPEARRMGIEVLDIVDRGLERGFLAPVPSERACAWCDFRPVCGPGPERRVGRKAPELVADLLELRKKP